MARVHPDLVVPVFFIPLGLVLERLPGEQGSPKSNNKGRENWLHILVGFGVNQEDGPVEVSEQDSSLAEG